MSLVRYDAACRALAEAKTVDEAKELHDKAEAMRAYARQAKNKGLEVDAAEIRIRAERRLGEILTAAKETGQIAEGRPSKNCANEEQFSRVRLNDAGVDRKLSSRAQKLAAVPTDKFESMLGEWQERVSLEGERVTTRLLRAGDNARRDAALAVAPTVWPEGQYPVIYADPPWRYEHPPMGSSSRSIENHYPTMTVDEICALPVAEVAADDSVLLLWATAPKLWECCEVMAAWGFTYRTCLVWVKDKIGMGYWARNRHELLLVGCRGGMSPPLPENRFDSVIDAPRRGHSAKPEKVYEIIERMFPDAPKLELFSRSQRDGWAAWGNQVGATSNGA